MADDGGGRKYSCKTASETLEWIHAIIHFLKPYRFFLDAHVVNFFKAIPLTSQTCNDLPIMFHKSCNDRFEYFDEP